MQLYILYLYTSECVSHVFPLCTRSRLPPHFQERKSWICLRKLQFSLHPAWFISTRKPQWSWHNFRIDFHKKLFTSHWGNNLTQIEENFFRRAFMRENTQALIRLHLECTGDTFNWYVVMVSKYQRAHTHKLTHLQC